VHGTQQRLGKAEGIKGHWVSGEQIGPSLTEERQSQAEEAGSLALV